MFCLEAIMDLLVPTFSDDGTLQEAEERCYEYFKRFLRECESK